MPWSVLVLLAMATTSCSGGPPFQPAQPKTDMALLYLYRTSSMVGAGNHDIAAVNGKPVAEMESGSYFVMDFPPGNTVISRKAASALGWWGPGVIRGLLEGFVEREQFEAKPGHRYFVRFPIGELEKDEAEARDDLRGLTLLQPYR